MEVFIFQFMNIYARYFRLSRAFDNLVIELQTVCIYSLSIQQIIYYFDVFKQLVTIYGINDSSCYYLKILLRLSATWRNMSQQNFSGPINIVAGKNI